ncbi:hypothetical protein CICLE_v10017554mg [Citrus x clementina]|uniref:Bidirectional sugar transporter SWEET n=1 Tax=Citrus clementina TaxID=85681 RepID=V4TH55_CITCL|nr:hypothetical protein CICLE_v10017554mg [Citrus x clementina]
MVGNSEDEYEEKNGRRAAPCIHRIRAISCDAANQNSNAFWRAPSIRTPTFWRIIKRKDTEEFHPYAYICACMNCMFWILYGLPVVHPDSTLVVTINGVGLALELIYLSIFCVYNRQKKGRKIVAIGLLGEVAFLGVIAVITFVVFHNTNTRTLFVGIICDIFNIIMYASPLSIWTTFSIYTTQELRYV